MRDFYQKTTKYWDTEIRVDNVKPDITSNTVTAIFKANKSDADASAVITATADVATSGADGVAEFTLSVSDTTVTPAKLFYEIRWTIDAVVYIIESSSVSVLERVYD